MLTPETIEKLNLIYKHFGFYKQVNKLNEESIEFIFANNKNKGDNIIEEMADIFIICSQLYLNSPAIQEQVEFKINRTLQRIADGYYDNGEKRNT